MMHRCCEDALTNYDYYHPRSGNILQFVCKECYDFVVALLFQAILVQPDRLTPKCAADFLSFYCGEDLD